MASSMLAFDISGVWAALAGFACVVATMLFGPNWRRNENAARLFHTFSSILQMKPSTMSSACLSGEDSSLSTNLGTNRSPCHSGSVAGEHIGKDAPLAAPLGTIEFAAHTPKTYPADSFTTVEFAACADMKAAVVESRTFWELCQSLPDATCLSCATRTVLVDALQQSGIALSDADCAVDVAVACCDFQLGDAALMTGMRLGCGSAWLVHAYRRLTSSRIPVEAQYAVDVARLYGRENRGDLAVDFWLEVRDAVKMNAHVASTATVEMTYGAALEACVNNGDLEVAARAARSAAWRAPPCIAGQTALLTIVRWLARRQDLTAALECYDSVRKVGGAIDLQTYRSLLAACVRNVDMLKASELFHDLVASGLNLDLSTFSAMIRGYCAAGNLEQAMTLLHLLRRRGLTPDIFLFNAILEGCCSRGTSMLAEQVLKDMEDVGVLPSSQTVAILVRLYGRARSVERSMEVFEEFPKRYGIELSSQTFGTVISVCLSHARYDLATDAFINMKQAGCTPDARTYEALILGCLRQGDVERAACLVDDALGLNKGNPQDSRSLVRTCLRPKLVEDVLRLIGRRRLAKQLGEPLLLRLRKMGFEISESLSQSLLRSAEAESEAPCSRLDVRRVERQLWRDFSSSAIAVA